MDSCVWNTLYSTIGLQLSILCRMIEGLCSKLWQLNNDCWYVNEPGRSDIQAGDKMSGELLSVFLP